MIEKAKEACNNSWQQAFDHFEDILEMVAIGSKTHRNVDSIKKLEAKEQAHLNEKN